MKDEDEGTSTMEILEIIGLSVIWIFIFYGSHIFLWSVSLYFVVSLVSTQLAILASGIGVVGGIYHAKSKV